VHTRKAINDPHEIPADAKLIIIAQPLSKFAGEELDALDTYVAAGGKLMVLSNRVVELAGATRSWRTAWTST
jgi:hypothetical protein